MSMLLSKQPETKKEHELKKTLWKLGLGQRVEREMTENVNLLTPLEYALFNRDFN